MSTFSRRAVLGGLTSVALAARARAATAQTPAAAPYVINVVISQTGQAANIGADQTTALVAYEKIVNRTGGIGGRPVHFQVFDDQSSPQIAVQLLNTLLAAKPAIVMGSCLAPAASAMMPFFKDGPLLYATTPIVYPEKGRYVFAPSSLISYADEALFRYLRLKGITKIAFIRTNDVSGQDNGRSVDVALALPENKAIVTSTKLLFNPTDFSIAAQATAIKNSDAQLAFVSATGTSFGTVLRGLSDAGINLPIYTSATNLAPTLLDRFKGTLPKAGLVAVGPSFFKRERPANDPLRAPIEEFYTAIAAEGGKANASHAFAWDPARIIVGALRKLGANATTKQLRDYIATLHGFPGALGMYDFRTGDQHGLDDRAMYVVKYDPYAANPETIVVSDAGGVPLRGV